MDQSNDRVGDYGIYHLPPDATVYKPMMIIKMTEEGKDVSNKL